MTEPTQPPKPTVPLAIRKSTLSQREKRRRRLAGEKRTAAEAREKSRAKKGTPEPKPKIVYAPRKKDGVLEAQRVDKPTKAVKSSDK